MPLVEALNQGPPDYNTSALNHSAILAHAVSDAHRKGCIKPLKESILGVARALFDP